MQKENITTAAGVAIAKNIDPLKAWKVTIQQR
jgi:hypothetical protein